MILRCHCSTLFLLIQRKLYSKSINTHSYQYQGVSYVWIIYTILSIHQYHFCPWNLFFHQYLIFLCLQYKHTTDGIISFCILLQREQMRFKSNTYSFQIVSFDRLYLKCWMSQLSFRNNSRGAEELSIWERMRLPIKQAVFSLSSLEALPGWPPLIISFGISYHRCPTEEAVKGLQWRTEILPSKSWLTSLFPAISLILLLPLSRAPIGGGEMLFVKLMN